MADVTINTSLIAPVTTGSNPTRVVWATATETINPGLVLKRSGVNQVALADDYDDTVVGVALAIAHASQPVPYASAGDLSFGTPLVDVGILYVLSNSGDGAIAPVSDQQTGWPTQLIGQSISSSVIRLNITNPGVAFP